MDIQQVQFVHRNGSLMPESKLQLLLQQMLDFILPDQKLKFPYGTNNTGIDLQKAYNKRLVILLGEKDNDPSLGTLRTTELTMW